MSHELQVNDLGFEEAKTALIDYLTGQAEFNDYDFTGSTMNILLDVCANVIHNVGLHANFALRESFLESAQLRKNVVAKAKEIGYFPRQPQAARANFKLTLDLTGEGSPPTTITVPKGTNFSSTLADGSTINFLTYDDNPLVDEGTAIGDPATKVLSGTVYIAQGYFGAQTWIAQDPANQTFILSQPDVDIDFLVVTVKPTQASLSKEIWTYANDLTQVGPSTETFFLNENAERVQIYFGNGVLGKALSELNHITADYLTTRGQIANGLKVFSLNANIAGYSKSLFTFGVITAANAGADREDIDSIKLLAPLSYQRQNRIVTLDDYKSAVLETYGNVSAINAWGGEDADPPQYGKVFVSVKPLLGETISPTTKKSIEEDILSRQSVVGITPEIVDPDYTFINLVTTVYYNKDKTTLLGAQIGSSVAAEIEEFFADSVFDYEQSFKYSKMVSRIDAVQASITNSTSILTLSKKFEPQETVVGTYSVKFYNQLTAGTLVSDLWQNLGLSNSQLKDDGLGNIHLYKAGTIVNSNVGTVNYVTGAISLTLNPEINISGTKITFTVSPALTDIDVTLNNLVTLGTNTVSTQAVVK